MTAKKLVAVMLVAVTPFVGGCGTRKITAKEKAPPVSVEMQPNNTAATLLEGKWVSQCYSVDGIGYKSTAIFQGDLLTYSWLQYTNAGCTAGGTQSAKRQSHFSTPLGTDDDINFTVTYTDGSFSGQTETVALGGASISFPDTETDDAGEAVPYFRK